MATRLVEGLTEHDVVTEPFPHVVVGNARPDQRVQQLISDWPDDAVFRGGRAAGSNRRFNYNARQVMRDTTFPESWRSFTATHVSGAFARECVRLFAPWIRSEYSLTIGG